MVLETEKTPDKPLHRIAERYRPTLTFNHQRSHPLPPGTYAHAMFAPHLASAYSDFASALLQPTHWRQDMFAEWLSNSTVVARAEEVGAIKLLKTHFVQLPPGSFSKVRGTSCALQSRHTLTRCRHAHHPDPALIAFSLQSRHPSTRLIATAPPPAFHGVTSSRRCSRCTFRRRSFATRQRTLPASAATWLHICISLWLMIRARASKLRSISVKTKAVLSTSSWLKFQQHQLNLTLFS